MIPVVDVLFLCLYQLKLLLGVVDEGAQLFLLALTDGGSEYFAHLALDVSRGILQHVDEGFVLAVQVGQEVLSAFGQVEDGLQVDNLAGSIGHVRVGG